MADRAPVPEGQPDPQALAVMGNTNELATWAQTHLGLRPDRFLGMGSRILIEPPGAVVFELHVMLTVEDTASLKEILP